MPSGQVPFGSDYAAVALNGTATDPSYPSAVTVEVSDAVHLSRSTR